MVSQFLAGGGKLQVIGALRVAHRPGEQKRAAQKRLAAAGVGERRLFGHGAHAEQRFRVEQAAGFENGGAVLVRRGHLIARLAELVGLCRTQFRGDAEKVFEQHEEVPRHKGVGRGDAQAVLLPPDVGHAAAKEQRGGHLRAGAAGLFDLFPRQFPARVGRKGHFSPSTMSFSAPPRRRRALPFPDARPRGHIRAFAPRR